MPEAHVRKRPVNPVRTAYHGSHEPLRPHRRRRLLPRAVLARRALRRPVLHRRHLHRHLLPTGVPRAHAPARELSLLRARRAGRTGGLPALPALPARAGAARAALVDGRRLHHPGAAGHVVAGRPPALAGRRRRRDGRAPGGAAGRERPPPAARLRGTPGRLAAAVPAHAQAAHGQAAAGRHRPARHPDRPGQRLCQRAALQRGLSRALPAQPHAAAARNRHPRHRPGHRGAAGLPAAVRRGGHAGLLPPAPDRRRGLHRRTGPAPGQTLRMELGGRTHTGWLVAGFDEARSQLELRVSDDLREVLPR